MAGITCSVCQITIVNHTTSMENDRNYPSVFFILFSSCKGRSAVTYNSTPGGDWEARGSMRRCEGGHKSTSYIYGHTPVGMCLLGYDDLKCLIILEYVGKIHRSLNTAGNRGISQGVVISYQQLFDIRLG